MKQTPPLPKAVTFDCWNTLIAEEDWETAHALRVAAMRDAAREGGIDVPLEVSAKAFDQAWDRHMALWGEGAASGAAEVAEWGLALLGAAAEGPVMEHLVKRFEEASHSSRLVALEGAEETLRRLDESGVRQALICDSGLTPGRVVRKHLERLGLLRFLSVQVFSDEVGVPKPSPRIFHVALDALGSDPAQSLHVGDLRRTDVAGARGVGMATVRLRSRNDDSTSLPDADRVADSHAHLRELLGLGPD
jgi:putative hydrolase of the HAD superfamily